MQLDQIKRRQFITLLGSGAATWPLAARAQQPAMPTIGYLDSRSPEAVAERLRGHRQGLKEGGYIEKERVGIAYRWAENQPHRLQELAADLVRRGVAAIVTAGPPATFAARPQLRRSPSSSSLAMIQCGLALSRASRDRAVT